MKIGMNMNWTSTYEPFQYWTNITKNISSWIKDGDDRKAVLGSGSNLEPGVYHFSWNGRGHLSVGSYSGKLEMSNKLGPGSYKIKIPSSSSGAVMLWAHGDTDILDVQIVSDYNIDRHTSGKSWDLKYVQYLMSLNVSSIRFMNMSQTNVNYSSSYEELPSAVSLSYAMGCPIRVMAELCNEIQADPWFNVSTRLSDEAIIRQAKEWNLYLNRSMTLSVEYSNENWNYLFPFADNMAWVRYLHLNKKRGTVDGSRISCNRHELNPGDNVAVFRGKDAHLVESKGDWRIGMGIISSATPISENLFSLTAMNGSPLQDFGDNKDLYFCKVDSSSSDRRIENLIERCSFVARVYSDKSIYAGTANNMLPSQSGNVWLTKMMKDEAERTKTYSLFNSLATAPYLSPSWWGIKIVIKNGVVTPYVWSSSDMTYHFSGHIPGKRPSDSQIIRNEGGSINLKYSGIKCGKEYVDLGKIGSIDQGTQYEASFIATDSSSIDTRIDILVRGDGTYYGFVKDEDHMTKEMTVSRTLKSLSLRQRAMSGLRMHAYEGGHDYSKKCPTEMSEWIHEYYKSESSLRSTNYYLQMMRESGFEVFHWYKDQSLSEFSLFSDRGTMTKDSRYLAISGYKDSGVERTPPDPRGFRGMNSRVSIDTHNDTMNSPVFERGAYSISPNSGRWPSLSVYGLFDILPVGHILQVIYDAKSLPVEGADGMEISLSGLNGELKRIHSPLALSSGYYISYMQEVKNTSKAPVDVKMFFTYNNIESIQTGLRIRGLRYRIVNDNP